MINSVRIQNPVLISQDGIDSIINNGLFRLALLLDFRYIVSKFARTVLRSRRR